LYFSIDKIAIIYATVHAFH